MQVTITVNGGFGEPDMEVTVEDDERSFDGSGTYQTLDRLVDKAANMVKAAYL